MYSDSNRRVEAFRAVVVWRCWGDDRRLWAEPTEEYVQLLCPLQAAWWLSVAHLTPGDLLHSCPHIPHIVLLEFGLQLPPVGDFTGPQHIPESMLHSPLWAVGLYASLAFAYKRSSVLSSLEGQSTYWWNVGRVLSSVTWLKSLVMIIKALGCCVCNWAAAATAASAEGGTYTLIKLADMNSQGK